MMRPSLLTTPAPSVAVEITPRQVAAILLSARAGTPVIDACAAEALPAGAVAPALNSANISDRGPVVNALRLVLGRLEARPRRVALVVPDCIAKVSILRLDKVPSRSADLDQLIRWHVRKAAPFRLEDAQVTFASGAATDGGGREFVVAVARRDVVQEYERVCVDAGVSPGLVDIATFDLINAVLASERPPAGDWLLVNVTPEYSTMGILRGSHLIFFRNRVEEGDGNLADLVHQTAMYYVDRLSGQGFERVLLAGAQHAPVAAVGPAPRGAEQLRRSLEERLGVRVEAIDPRKLASFTERAAVDGALVSMVTPLLGVLLRERGKQ